MYIENTRILIFDELGSYTTTIQLKRSGSVTKNDEISFPFQVVNQNIIYINNNSLIYYNLTTGEENPTPLPYNGEIKCARIENKRLFILTEDDFRVFEF